METKRQALHIAVGFLIILLRWLPLWSILLVALAGILFNLFFLPRLFPMVMRNIAGDRRGIVFYPVAVAALAILVPGRKEVLAGAWAMLAFGDGMATMIGHMDGNKPLRWNPAKTVQGSLSCFVFGALGCFAAIMLVCPELVPFWRQWAIVSIVAAAMAAWVESMPLPINDNLTVPFVAAAVLWLPELIDIRMLGELNGWYMVVAILTNGVLASILTSFRIIQGSATWAGVILGSVLAVCGGWQCYLLLVLFFVMGTTATKHGFRIKDLRGIAQHHGGRRGARHVVANCGIPTLFAFLVACTPYPVWMKLALVASLATALMDTLATELGQVYGHYPVLPTTGETVPVGTEGAISMEGTLLGLAGTLLFSLAASLLGTIPFQAIPLILVTAFAGCNVESLFAALHKEEFAWRNELLNFGNTLFGGALALYFAWQVFPPN